MSTVTPPPVSAPSAAAQPMPPGRSRRRVQHSSLAARGEPMIWLTGGSLVICLVMIVGLLVLVFYNGLATFWPRAVVQVTVKGIEMPNTAPEGTYMGPIIRQEAYVRQLAGADAGIDAERTMLRTANFDVTQTHFTWVQDEQILETDYPEWATTVERISWGRFFGYPAKFILDGQEVADEPAAVWALYQEHHGEARHLTHRRETLEGEIGDLNRHVENARLSMRAEELDHGVESEQYVEARRYFEQLQADANARSRELREDIERLKEESARYRIAFATAAAHVGEKPTQLVTMELGEIIRAFPANQLSLGQKTGVYLARWWEFLSAEPREANSEGGVWPAIFGTVMMTMIMTLAVVPFGVLAALYLREYAKGGTIVSIIRISINNLAGVPSIVYGVFGLGFFCYMIGASVDQVFFEASLPNPTFGKSAILWASLTLALLTAPVVIVATEEALAAVPNSMREGSYACGASKWQTIRRIVLPRALPGMMTGAILAISRGAGEVAPLMIVGAVKLAPELPFSVLPSENFGLNRSFMHLGFHIYDLGFQSQNSEAAKPMVFTTTLLLIVIVATLNIAAIYMRTRLRRRFQASAF